MVFSRTQILTLENNANAGIVRGSKWIKTKIPILSAQAIRLISFANFAVSSCFFFPRGENTQEDITNSELVAANAKRHKYYI